MLTSRPNRFIANPFYHARLNNRNSLPAGPPTAPRHRPSARFQVLDLFSGIGGFSLGLERAGMQTAAFCEIDGFCRRLLARHWPGVPIYPEIKQLTARRLHHDHIKHIDLICGGYPCQPFSVAGHQRGERDPRHLWPEMYRILRELRPRWLVCENVAGHVELGLDAVLGDLEAAGYSATTFVIPACAVGAPHRRDRVWIVAHAPGLGLQGPLGKEGRQLTQELSSAQVWRHLPAPFTCGSIDGIPFGVDRLRALGNAVVPQIPELIGKAILACERAAESMTQIQSYLRAPSPSLATG
jgi:DNA (cytosine-5)-methyltransferase 1